MAAPSSNDSYELLKGLLEKRAARAPRRLPATVAIEMGLPVPSVVTETAKSPIRKLTPRHRAVISMHLQGWGHRRIAEETGFSLPYISIILNNPRVEEIIQGALKLADKELAALFPRSVDRLRDALDTEDPKVYLRAVELTLKANGKLKDVDVKSSTTAEDVARRLIEIRSSGPVEITVAEEQRNG